ncbi:LacI family DNA-binding transcriptional regulator [Gayadomonas joobiniege]|uniref:LacI family DNA-binding transcriptional regulator n=1 Tax=Gayadomonas joobiniege TaxID=1234606 RepID=UPI00037A4F0D|nr:LacI family DNA-binding transcriptional regulator [Gayadomonas joobiniege]
MPDQKITINDIARLSGVSKRTVSRVINNSPKVGAATKAKVTEVIAQYNYVPDKQARGLASSRSYLLGLVYDNPDALFIDDAQRGILSVCSQQGYELVVHPCRYKSPDFQQNVLNFVRRSKLDGVIVLPPASEVDALGEVLTEQEIPFVRLVSGTNEVAENFIMSDDRAAAAEVAQFLVDLGHRQIALMTGPDNYRSSKERQLGFIEAIKERGLKLPKELVVSGNNDYHTAIKKGLDLLKQNPRPSAIFCNNDEMAAGVLKAAHELAIKVPEALSVCGFDDNLLASRIIPELTTIKRPVSEMGKYAARKLIAKIEKNNPDAVQQKCLVRPELVVRDSTGLYSD